MRTLRPSLDGTVILALVGGLGSAVVAQDEEGAAAGLQMGPARSTITDDGLVEATDPRMSGTLVERDFNVVDVPVRDQYVATIRSRLSSDVGAWECWSDEYGHVPDESYGQAWCVGEGGFEGLSAIMFASSDADTHGLIYEGAPLREPPAE